MMTGKYLICVCVMLWTLAIRSTVGEKLEETSQDLLARRPLDMWEEEKEQSEDDQENEDEDDELRLYDAAEPAVRNLLVTYLQKYGKNCTKKHLVLTIVGEGSRETSVQSVLNKLSTVFNLERTHGPAEQLHMMECCKCVKPGKPRFFRRLCWKRVRPFKTDMHVEDIPTEHVFIGRDKSQQTCEATSLIDEALAALPVATERALPTVIMEAENTPKDQSEKPSILPFCPNYYSYEALLQRMLPRTDRLYWGKDEHGDAESLRFKSGSDQPVEGEPAGDKDTQLKSDIVYLHTQAQLDLLFPSRTFFPVSVPNPTTKEITVNVRAVHAFPADASSYECCSSRVLRLTERSWQIIRNSPCRGPPCRFFESEPITLAKLLVARDGSVSDQQPVVVLLELCRKVGDGTELWKETQLEWELTEKPPLTTENRPTSTFGERMAANSRFASKLVTAISQSGVTRLLVNDMVKRYNVDKEEMMSMWDRNPQNSALKLSSVQAAFTRPLNIPVLRPMHPLDVLVSPVDSVIQRMYQLAPDDEGIIQDTVIPQLKGVNFKLLDLLYGSKEKTPLRLKSAENRLNVLIHYLSPQDYHRVHSPADWVILQKTYIPGCTPSVNRKHLGRNSVLHEIERTSLTGTWDPRARNEDLFFSVTLVAATLVGGISLAWEEKPSAPRTFLKDCSKITEVFEEQINVPMCVGQELGSFRIGSTVVLIFESPPGFDLTRVGTCNTVRLGQTEGRLAYEVRHAPERCMAYPSAHDSAAAYVSWLHNNQLTAGTALMKNTQLPSSWRSSPAEVVEKTIRSVEKGMLNMNAFGQQLFHYFAQEPEKWTRVVIGQPVALLKSGGIDATTATLLPLCFATKDKKQIRLKLQGKVSTLVLFLQTTGEEQLLFKQPHFGCDGDAELGKRIRGLTVTWILYEDSRLAININVDCGLGGEDQCVVTDGAAIITGAIHVKGNCRAGETALQQPGSTTLDCTVEKLEPSVVEALAIDIYTKELVCEKIDEGTPPEVSTR